MARAVAGNTSITFDLASNERLVVYTQGRADVFRVDGGNTLLGSVNGVEQSFGPIANGGTVRIDSFDHTVFFANGTCYGTPDRTPNANANPGDWASNTATRRSARRRDGLHPVTATSSRT
jgi:hypothetical protein